LYNFFSGDNFVPVALEFILKMSKRKADLESYAASKALKKSRSDETNEPETREEKAARKAAKKLRKEEKRAKKALKEDGSANGVEFDGTEQSEPAKRDKKDKKKKEKKTKSTSEENGDTLAKETAKIELSTTSDGDIEAYMAQKEMKIVDPLSSKTHSLITQFSQLPNGGEAYSTFLKAFKEPTPIQAATWPFLFANRDAIGVAETGSGKTLAFGMPCIERIRTLPKHERKGVKAVIVSPTRELASQIHEQLEKLAGFANLNTVCIYGGVPKDEQRFKLKTAQIVVATPGRLNDLLSENAADLSSADFVCLDEADRMLDTGFEQDIRKILSAVAPKETRQTVMFTATWPQSIRDLASTFMKDPVQIYIGNTPSGDLKANTRIEQVVEVMDPRDKERRLHQLLQEYTKGSKSNDRILVFCLYKKEAARIEEFIRYRGFNVAGIHGDLIQSRRTAALQGFKSGQTPILVATDVAARGLDIPAVKLVINVTFPLTAEDYVHRIGR
jgi:ATP-dependent RNA helicase DBP3